MRSRYASIPALVLFLIFHAGCTSQFLKRPEEKVVAPEIVSSGDISPPAMVPDSKVTETPADTPVYSEEEAILSAILNLYNEAVEALDGGDYSLAETRIDSAAVMSSDIDIASIGDESLALRYMNTLSSLFQDYGRIFRDVDQINKEDPLNWLNQLSEMKPEDFKNGMWKDDELRQIVRKISLRCDMPIEYNDQVKKSIYFFQTVKKQTMEKWIRRSGRYLPIIEEIFEAHDIPLDLAYLAMIESGFSAKAYSRAHCSGLWQFSSSTGRLYGLKSSQWDDQRRDPIASTKAAARYLNDLYKIYGDWFVVMAAYNWGPAGINRQIKAGNTDFWSMETPSETRNHVPSIIAAVIISKAPELFGLENIEKEAPLTFDTVEVPYTSLETAAKCAGVDLNTIKEMNTGLIKSHTPAERTYALRIPAGTKESFMAEYANLPKEIYSPPETESYYVKRGDTLSGIAAKFRVSISSLVAENGIRNRNKLRVGQRLSIPGHATSTRHSRSSVATKALSQANDKGMITYIIKQNDTLYEIALEYNVSYRDIMDWNNITNHRTIRPGQKIVIKAKG